MNLIKKVEISKKNSMINIMKFISSILVIAIHTSPISGEWGYFLCNVISRIAVPFFFVTTGYFYYEKIQNNEKYIRKYIKKIFILYTSWYLIYFILRCFWEFKSIGFKSIVLLIREYLFSGYYQLWYLSSLIISLIFINYFIKNKMYRLLIISSVLLFIVGILGDSYSGLFNNKIIELTIKVYTLIFGATKTGLCFAVPFLVLGIFINKYNIKSKIKINNLMIISTSILFIIEALVLKYKKIGIARNMYIVLIILVPIIFIRLLQSKIEIKESISIRLQKYSTVIYCTHALFIIIFNRFLNISNLYLFILVTLFSLCIAVILTKYNNRIFRLLV